MTKKICVAGRAREIPDMLNTHADMRKKSLNHCTQTKKKEPTMIERFSKPASQTLIGNLLQLNAIIIRDSVSQRRRHIGKKFFESGDNKKL